MLIQALRDVSLVILSILSFVMCLVPLIVMYFAVRGTRALKSKTQAMAPQAQAKVQWAQALVDQGTEKVAAPVIRAHRFYAQWTTSGRALLRSLRRQAPHSD